jgi:hypothetical protein
MPMRRILDFSAFIIGVLAMLLLRYGFDYGWLLSLGIGLVVFIVIPFVVSRFYALFLLRRMERSVSQTKTRR